MLKRYVENHIVGRTRNRHDDSGGGGGANSPSGSNNTNALGAKSYSVTGFVQRERKSGAVDVHTAPGAAGNKATAPAQRSISLVHSPSSGNVTYGNHLPTLRYYSPGSALAAVSTNQTYLCQQQQPTASSPTSGGAVSISVHASSASNLERSQLVRPIPRFQRQGTRSQLLSELAAANSAAGRPGSGATVAAAMSGMLATTSMLTNHKAASTSGGESSAAGGGQRQRSATAGHHGNNNHSAGNRSSTGYSPSKQHPSLFEEKDVDNAYDDDNPTEHIPSNRSSPITVVGGQGDEQAFVVGDDHETIPDIDPGIGGSASSVPLSHTKSRQTLNERVDFNRQQSQPSEAHQAINPHPDIDVDETPFVAFGGPLRGASGQADNAPGGGGAFDSNSQYSYYQHFYRQQQAARGLAEMLDTVKLRSSGRDRQRKHEDAQLTSSPIFHSFIRPCAAEFLGTIIYVYFTSFGRPLSPRPSELVCIGLMRGVCTLLSMLMLGHISGGHFNPAITIAAWISGGIRTVLVIFYVICQFFGAFIAALLVRATVSYQDYDDISGGMTFVPVGHISITPHLTNNVDSQMPSRLQAIVLELLITYILCLAYAMTMVDTDGRCAIDGPVTVSGAILVGTMAAYSSTRASMNPAKSFGAACAYAIFRPESVTWDYHYVYWIGPLSGAILAALSYRCLYAADLNRIVFTREIIKSEHDNESAPNNNNNNNN